MNNGISQPNRQSRLSISRIKRQKRELEGQANSIAAQPSGDSRSPIDDQQWDNSIFPPISEDSVVLNELTILPSNKDSSNIEQHSDSNCSMNEIIHSDSESSMLSKAPTPSNATTKTNPTPSMNTMIEMNNDIIVQEIVYEEKHKTTDSSKLPQQPIQKEVKAEVEVQL